MSAKLRVDSSTLSGRELTACTIAYFTRRHRHD
jgi:hypothetical protein